MTTSSNSIDTIFKDSINKLNSILMYLDHQLGTVSLTKEEILALGGIKNSVEPAHFIVTGDLQKKEGPKKETAPKKDSASKKDEPKKDEPKKEEPKKDEQKKDEPKKEKKEKKEKKKKDEPKQEELKGEEGKKEDKKQKSQKKGMDPSEIFKLCDLRVGYVEECKEMEGFDDIYSLVIDLGEPEKRIIGTGLRKFVPIEKIKSTKLVVFSNLRPKKFGKDFESNGMILTAGLVEGNEKKGFEIIRPDENAKPGDKIYLEGMELDSKKEEQITGGRFKQAMEYFKTDDEFFCTYNGTKIRTQTGFVKAGFKNAPIS